MVFKYIIYDFLKDYKLIDICSQPQNYKSLGILGGIMILYPHIVKSFNFYEVKRSDYNNYSFMGSLFLSFYSYSNSYTNAFILSSIWGSVSFIGESYFMFKNRK